MPNSALVRRSRPCSTRIGALACYEPFLFHSWKCQTPIAYPAKRGGLPDTLEPSSDRGLKRMRGDAPPDPNLPSDKHHVERPAPA